jgi:hypothetical protein
MRHEVRDLIGRVKWPDQLCTRTRCCQANGFGNFGATSGLRINNSAAVLQAAIDSVALGAA